MFSDLLSLSSETCRINLIGISISTFRSPDKIILSYLLMARLNVNLFMARLNVFFISSKKCPVYALWTVCKSNEPFMF